jgi:methyl-accepting chemotaxis protein WspA
MLKKLKIKDLILIGFSIPSFLILGLSVIVYLNSNQIEKTFMKVTEAQTVLVLEDRMAVSFLNMDRRIRRYIIDPNIHKDALVLYTQSRQEFENNFQESQAIITVPKQIEISQRLKSLVDQYHKLQTETFQNGSNINQDNNFRDFVNQSRLITQEYEELSQQFSRNEKEILQSRIADTQSSIFFLRVIAVSVSILSICVATIATFVISQFLGKRIASAVNAAEVISEGDLTLSSLDSTSNRDEVAVLLKAFQSMVGKLSSLIRQVQQSGIQVTSSTTQIAASGKQLEAMITEQMASTNQVTASAREISSTSKELVKTMEEVALMSQLTTTAANDSQQDLQRMETTMRQLAAATNSIADRLGVISEKANSINNVVVTITKVADQTNLLSLNAAIEAEKAGEYGLGFAVVAREIRRLADQTAVATLDIERMVKQMQSSVSTGVMEMDKFATEVGRAVEDVANISSQITKIIAQFQDLTPRFEAVNQGMEIQSQGAEQISDAMNQLNTNSAQTAASLREINNAIAQLNQVAQGLRQEISRFKVNVDYTSTKSLNHDRF